MKKRFKILIIFLFLLFILLFNMLTQNSLTKLISSPCGYVNFAWSAVRGECDCVGIKIDTSCIGCMDTGTSYGCIGIVKDKQCFQIINKTETQVNCR